MQFIRTDDLKPGMRLARPIYNKMGVMLYERDTKLTQQGIMSVRNFGLIGIYILEPAEPVPPMTKEELEFEQFQTITVFQLKDDMTMLRNHKPPKNLQSLPEAIIKHYGSLKHRINFLQNVRSTSDFVYKHCLSTAILSAMILSGLTLSHQDKKAIVTAALFHDIGKLLVPPDLLEKGEELDKTERRQLRRCLEEGYALLDPDYNQYMLPELTMQILGQIIYNEHTPGRPLDPTIKWHTGSQVIHVANTYDTLTAMQLGKEPASELAAIRYLVKHADYYPRNVVAALTQRIHVLPMACCVDLSDGTKGLVLSENPDDFMTPIIIKFSDNSICDLSDPKVRKKLQIMDIMKTMDNRIKVDEETLQQFTSDPHIQEVTDRFLKKHDEFVKAGKL